MTGETLHLRDYLRFIGAMAEQEHVYLDDAQDSLTLINGWQKTALAILDAAETLRVDPVDDSLIADAVGWEHIANPFERVRLIPDPLPVDATAREPAGDT